MTAELRRIPVSLPGQAYDVVVGEGLLPEVGHLIREREGLGKKCAIVTDSNVGPRYADALADRLFEAGFHADILTVPAGESSKSMLEAEDICRQMIRAGHDRNSFLIALGGGVVGDLAGFAAAIFFRGIPYIQIPTTVVSQVDSSVGGKTGVNAHEGKNLIGAFHQPRLVIADTLTLDSLPDRAYNEGFAEIIKHAAIRDATMLDRIAALPRRGAITELVAQNVAIKAAIVVEDEKETNGTRALLNFGHTIGHGIEASAGYGVMMHGEAISLGLLAAARLSVRHSTLPESDAEKLRSLLGKFDLPLTLPAPIETDAILEALSHDKKFRAGEIRFVLLRALGDAFVSGEITLRDITCAIDDLRA